jgi:hypothetical protein
MRYGIFGDDGGSDDRMVTLNRWFAGAGATGEGHLYATDTGIHYRRQYTSQEGSQRGCITARAWSRLRSSAST